AVIEGAVDMGGDDGDQPFRPEEAAHLRQDAHGHGGALAALAGGDCPLLLVQFQRHGAQSATAPRRAASLAENLSHASLIVIPAKAGIQGRGARWWPWTPPRTCSGDCAGMTRWEESHRQPCRCFGRALAVTLAHSLFRG